MTRLTVRELRRVSTVDALADVLRNAVLDGELPSGRVIKEAEIVDTYGVSRPTAKAAIRALVEERVLRQEPNRSAEVTEISAQDVVDLFRIRVPLELEILREIIKRRAAEDPDFELSKDTHGAVADMRTMVQEDVKPHEFVAVDLKFHRSLAESAGSDRLLQFFSALEGELHLSMVQSFHLLDREEITRQHQEILDRVVAAIESRSSDWAPAKAAMQQHLTSACTLIAQGLDSAHERSDA